MLSPGLAVLPREIGMGWQDSGGMELQLCATNGDAGGMELQLGHSPENWTKRVPFLMK